MSTSDAFLQQLRATFRIEAEEHVQAISAGLLELERAPPGGPQQRTIETVFRAAHSLKGAARAVDFGEIESQCQLLEDVFASWKHQQSVPAHDELDRLHRTLDAIACALAGSADSKRAAVPDTRSPSPPIASSPPAVSHEWQRAAATPLPPTFPPPEAPEPAPRPSTVPEKSAAEQTVRVAVRKLEAQLLGSEEMLVAKLAAGQRTADLRHLAGGVGALRRAWSGIEADVHALRQRDRGAAQDRPAAPELVRLIELYDSALTELKSLENKAAAFVKAAEQDRGGVARLVDDLLEESKKLLLLPFGTISGSFPKLVRDLCRDQGKEADFEISGEDIEVDKRLLEEMKDPLVHLLRNAIDHGIELPQDRVSKGKPPRASIRLAASQVNGSKVQLLLSDDGAGIDVAKVKEAAVRRGMISADDAAQLGSPEAQALIFRSEVSTSPIITEVSGRGLGLAIVREKAEKLGGEVSVESRPGGGAVFRMIIPATRATFRGILIEAGGQLLIVPTMHVERVGRAKHADVRTVEGRETLAIGGRTLAVVQLADILELPRVRERTAPPDGVPIMILGKGDERVAFTIDAVLDEQEVLVKPLGKPLSRVRNIAAATILASGQVAPILNVADLLRSVRKSAGAPVPAGTGAVAQEALAKSVLIAEDSITTRMLLKSILASAGYAVRTAVDGMEALTLLREEHFDLLVSDVEMPRLNGFDLTARVRADRKLAELPVVLVTALETRQDRERGIDVGANAYIVKGSFDQASLLDAVRRLI